MTNSILPRSTKKTCSVPGCDLIITCRDLCMLHYTRFRRGQDMSAPKKRFVIPELRFWVKVNKDGPTMPHMETACWVWLGGANADGYGQFRYISSVIKAHRYAFFLKHGRWPEPNALHHCDNPPCVNADHLFEGTQLDNVQDMLAKGRGQHQP